MKTLLVFLAALLVLTFPFISHAQIPRTLSYQGVLTDNAGKPRPDGNYTFKFCLYGSNSGGSSIWCESKSLSVKSGLFSTVLGEQTPFGAAVKFDQQYWLGIQVGNEPELSPRMALTSVGYSFSSLRADTARVAIATNADTVWRTIGSNVYRLSGNVGIGTKTPSSTLHVGNSNTGDIFRISTGGGFGALVENVNPGYGGKAKLAWIKSLSRNPDSYHFYVEGGEYPELVIKGDGKIGIGTDTPSSRLHVFHHSGATDLFQVTTAGGYGALIENVNPGYGGSSKLAWVKSENQNPDSYHLYVEGGSTPEFVVRGNGYVGIGTNNPQHPLDVNGRTRTSVLEITGGSDLAEPFEISESQPIPKGALVIIDEENPGRLKLSYQAYDKRVAGVVSGAGGINPGLTLTQEGVLESGQNVALSGRVYALATAANGPIKPGDLLTTSEVPGHAMKATDFVRWQGAVIGKAMLSLEKGEGLVLVLVNLQ